MMKVKCAALASAALLGCLFATTEANAGALSQALKMSVRFCRALGFEWKQEVIAAERFGFVPGRSALASAERNVVPRLTREDMKLITDELRRFAEEARLPARDAAPSAIASPVEAVAKSTERMKFSVLDGKLKYGSIKKFSTIEIEGGEINVYKIGAASSAAVYCGTSACYKTAALVIADESLKAKQLIGTFEKVNTNRTLGGDGIIAE